MQNSPKQTGRLWLKLLRISKGHTQASLGEAVELSAPTISAYESGEMTPKPLAAKRLGKELGFDWTRFYEDDKAEISGKEDEQCNPGSC